MSLPPPHPLFVSDPLSGVQEDRGGKGRSRCWSSPASWAPTAFSHGSDPPYMSEAPGISDRSPFYREHAPVGALDTETCPPLKQRSLGGGGGKGGSQGEGPGLVGGGWGEKSICDLKTPPLLGKNSTDCSLGPTTLLPWMTASLGIRVIRSSLADWRSMKKECRHARHSTISLRFLGILRFLRL